MIQTAIMPLSLSRSPLPRLAYQFFGSHHIDNPRMCFALNQMFAAFIIIATTVELQSEGEHMVAVYWSLMPMLGAIVASGMAFLLNRIDEGPKVIAGRFIMALVTGIGLPRILTYIHPWLKDLSLDPILLVLGGFFCGLMGYAAAKYTVDKFFKDAPGLVDDQMEKLRAKASGKPPKDDT